MGLFGGFEWGIIFFVIFLLFGVKRIPGFMRGIAEGIKEFRNTKADEGTESVKKV